MMRNFRIQIGARLNPSCAVDLEFESMLRTDIPQNLFPHPVRTTNGSARGPDNASPALQSASKPSLPRSWAFFFLPPHRSLL
jgi:hypothetical protein